MNPQVIHVNLEPLLYDHVSEDVVHECLKRRWSIAEAKEYDSGFKKAKGGGKGCFPLILFSDVNIIVSPSNIEFSKEGGILHVIDKLGDKRKRIAIANGMAIKVAIILARA